MNKKLLVKHSLYVVLIVLVIVGLTIGINFIRDNFMQDDTVTINGADDIVGTNIGVQIGTTGDIYVSDYEGDEEGTKIERYNKASDAVSALSTGKIDCIVLDEQPAKAYTAKDSSLKILDEEFANEEYAFCIAKGNDELTNKVNDALQQLRENGTLDKIIKNYVGNEDEIGSFKYEKADIPRPNGTLTVATNAEFKPYEYYENGVVTGADMDVMQAVCDILGMEMHVEDMDFDAIIAAVSTGKADIGASGMTVTEERKQSANFSDSYVTSKQVIIVKDNSAASAAANESFLTKLKNNFIVDNRYEYILQGLGNTLLIALLAVILGSIVGILIAIVRTTHDRTGKLDFLDFVCRIYLMIMRGTPVMIQLLIFYYVILVSASNKIMVAVIAFGLNSGAYVAEVVRSGIMSVPIGQMEAGRSLGLSYRQTMLYVIIPQAVKNVLPALGNEFISLLKETSIAGYIALVDLTKAADIIRSNTFDAFIPLISAALIYLIIIMILNGAIRLLERRLRKNER